MFIAINWKNGYEIGKKDNPTMQMEMEKQMNMQ